MESPTPATRRYWLTGGPVCRSRVGALGGGGSGCVGGSGTPRLPGRRWIPWSAQTRPAGWHCPCGGLKLGSFSREAVLIQGFPIQYEWSRCGELERRHQLSWASAHPEPQRSLWSRILFLRIRDLAWLCVNRVLDCPAFRAFFQLVDTQVSLSLFYSWLSVSLH